MRLAGHKVCVFGAIVASRRLICLNSKSSVHLNMLQYATRLSNKWILCAFHDFTAIDQQWNNRCMPLKMMNDPAKRHRSAGSTMATSLKLNRLPAKHHTPGIAFGKVLCKASLKRKLIPEIGAIDLW